ncbi:MAG: sulfate ABC transporter permease [Algoriphagus sp.]|nr:sulfate ABC transporter permease [Algoriphagus sp.]
MPKERSPLAQRLSDYLDFDKRLYFFLLVLLFILIRYLSNTIILEAIPDSENLDARGDFMIFHIFNTLEYVWTPFALLWKFTVIAFLFWLGAFFLGYKIPYKELWKFALVTEGIFLFPELIRFLVYINPHSASTYQEILEYRPLSLLSFIGFDNLKPRWYYPLGTLNLFELGYGVLWVMGFHMISNRSIKESILAVVVSYFVPLTIWLTWFVMVYRD